MRTIALVLGLLSAASAGKLVPLFNGQSLAGWHAQGDCQWSVVGGAIRGVNPNGAWCHLITDSSYADYSLDLDYRIVRGNSGLYVRAGRENAGCCGLEGTQVDIGPSQDGSVMWVKDGNWAWYELVTKAVTQGIVDYSKWNTVRVDLKGMGIRTYINGHAIYSNDNLSKAALKGTVALQLHDGGKGDTVFFRNINLYLPARIPGCMDPDWVEYDPEANFAVKESCRTRKATSVRASGGAAAMAGKVLLAGLRGPARVVVPAGFRRVELYDSRGTLAWAHSREARSAPQAVSAPASLGAGIYRVRLVQ